MGVAKSSFTDGLMLDSDEIYEEGCVAYDEESQLIG
jgi:hypothetical protein